jgi:hypothetical protein
MINPTGFQRHIDACNAWEPSEFAPFLVAGAQVGLVRHEAAERLARQRDLFMLDAGGLHLDPKLPDAAARSKALDLAVDRLVADGVLPKKRHEQYPVLTGWGAAPLATLDRGASPYFGIRAFGVHLNGYVLAPDGSVSLWIGTRSLDKAIAPGKLDNIVAGGQPIGLSLRENLIKECAEEANLQEDLARRAKSVGAITYRFAGERGLKTDTLFLYDLLMPESVIPENMDGELTGFALWPIEQVAKRLVETDDFKFNVALVLIDFMIRHGLFDVEHPAYLPLVHGLHWAG